MPAPREHVLAIALAVAAWIALVAGQPMVSPRTLPSRPPPGPTPPTPHALTSRCRTPLHRPRRLHRSAQTGTKRWCG